MAKILEEYRKNKNGYIEEKYTLINMQGDVSTSYESEEYSLEREKELLNEFRNNMLLKMYNYGYFCSDVQNEFNEFFKGISYSIIGSNFMSLICILYSFKKAKEFIIKYNNIKKIDKFMYFILNEDDFNTFNEHLGFGKMLNGRINKKVNDLCMSGSDFDSINMLKFSKRELKKIKNFSNKML